jgi:hypothetical protein
VNIDLPTTGRAKQEVESRAGGIVGKVSANGAEDGTMDSHHFVATIEPHRPQDHSLAKLVALEGRNTSGTSHLLVPGEDGLGSVPTGLCRLQPWPGQLLHRVRCSGKPENDLSLREAWQRRIELGRVTEPPGNPGKRASSIPEGLTSQTVVD